TLPYQPSPKTRSGRPAHRPFRGLLGVHSRCGLHTRAVTVFRDTLSEGFSHFVTSIAAPVASGWSVRRVGFAPTGKRRLVTAHGQSGHQPRFARQLTGAMSRGRGEHHGSAFTAVPCCQPDRPSYRAIPLARHVLQSFATTV